MDSVWGEVQINPRIFEKLTTIINITREARSYTDLPMTTVKIDIRINKMKLFCLNALSDEEAKKVGSHHFAIWR